MNLISEFKLNKTDKIIISSESALQEMFFCDEIEISLISDQKYRLNFDCFQYIFRGFIADLIDAIDGKLQLNSFIKFDLGYLLEQKYEGETKYIHMDQNNEWIGYKYLLFQTPGNFDPGLNTWLYNNEKGEIILEITPSYRWHFQDPKSGEAYITYEEFIRNYKPVLFRTIPKTVAQEWLEQAKALLHDVESRTCD